MYAELRSRTHYSFLRGASHPHELVARARELGLTAIAVTDRDGVYGIPRAWVAARDAGLDLITGAELTLELGNQMTFLTLLAMNIRGYGLLCRLLTASHEGHEKGTAGLPWSRFLEMLDGHDGRTGLIALVDPPAAETLDSEAILRALAHRFDGERLYLALLRRLDGADAERTRLARAWSERLALPIVATNDVHYHVAERRPLHDVLVSTRELKPLTKIGRSIFANSEAYLKSPEEMTRLFCDMPEAIANTQRIAERCRFRPNELRYYYPSEWIPEGETAQSWLEKLVEKGAERRYPQGIPTKVRAQISHEMKLISELGFADYFLTIWEVVDFARSRDILHQGRGSAANSVVCYCLGITAIDPVQMDLLFERFISVERGEPPDIDVDFENARREEVIQHVYEKYGRDRAGMVAAVVMYREKSAIRDVARALDVEPDKVLGDPRAKPLIEGILAFPRHLSIHSGGFTLSARPLIEIVPIEPARMEGRTIVQWDKDDLASLGLLKVDLLALGMMTAMQKTFKLLESRGVPLEIATIPHDDKKTYDMICSGDTVGVFQIESRAQMGMLKRLLPRNFYDLVIEVAIVRPGPIVGQMVHPYLRRRRRLEPVEYPDERLRPILARTLGVPLFQEQVMKIAIQLAGFTPGEADELRRAIGAWRSSGTLEKMGKKLHAGLLDAGLPPEFVERVFLQVQGFAEYGFPESHAASFALLAYASSYLKAHYPAEFLASLINSQPMGFYAVHTLIDTFKREGVRVLPLHPNVSEWDCTMEDGAVRIGWRVVSGLGEEAARRIVAVREARAFAGLADFLVRARDGGARLGYQVLQRLCMGGAFECFGFDRRQALWGILAFRSLTLLTSDVGGENTGVQLGLFGSSDHEYAPAATQEPARFANLSSYDKIRADFHSYGFSLEGHPMQRLREIEGVPPITSGQARANAAGRTVTIAGLIIARQRPPTAKGTAFATLEDEQGFVDLVIHAQTYEKFREVFVTQSFLVVTGKIQRDGQAVSLIVARIESLGELIEIVEERARARREHWGTRPNVRELRVGSRDFH